MFNISFSNQAGKFLKKHSSDLRKRIIDKIKSLKNDPVPHDAKSIVNEERMFRIRVGDYRILYVVKWNSQEIIVAVIDKRERAYD